MKSTRETRKVKEEQSAALQSKKAMKGDDTARPQRAAFGDLTNAVQKNVTNGKKEAGKVKQPAEVKVSQPVEVKVKVAAPRTRTTVAAAQAQKKTRKPAVTATAASSTTTSTTTTSKVACGQRKLAAEKAGKKSGEKEKPVEEPVEEPDVTSSQESAAAMLDIVMSDLESSDEEKEHSQMSLDRISLESSMTIKEEMPMVPVDEGVEDIDTGDQDDLSLVALYAYDIFLYYKDREEKFMLSPYMAKQPQVTQRMRAVLVDWMVEVQENFELNHETLYLGVKLVDTYLTVVTDVQRDILQLLGSVALFLSSKYDERMPPAIDDFIYICDNAYSRSQFKAMERELFRNMGFDLGRPISYRFLRRYARCGRCDVKTLYLARFVLELSLMEYKFVFQRESMVAASCLHIARQMRNEGEWTSTLEFYTGYTLQELKPLIMELNGQLSTRRNSDLCTIRDKYKHYLFHRVGEIPPLSNEDLFRHEDSECHVHA